MVNEEPGGSPQSPAPDVDAATAEAIRALLALDAQRVARIRAAIAPRPRPAGQHGPSADLGDTP